MSVIKLKPESKKLLPIIIGGGAAAVVLAALLFLFVFPRLRANSAEPTFPVFFFNASTGILETEAYRVPSPAEPAAVIDRAMQSLFGLPRSPALTRVWPEADGFLLGYKMNGNILEATFSDKYGTLTPMEEALFRTAFVMTMTGLPSVNYVRILPEGSAAAEGTGYLSAEDYTIDPEILPTRIATRQWTLFFVNDTMDGLVKRIHTSDQVDMDQEEMYIINQIIAGQAEAGVYAAIPPETKVSVELDESTSTCYVNLSSEIERFSGSQDLAELMLYSIVNSLAENINHVRRVQFQIDSQTVDQFFGVTGFNQVFEPNDELVLE